MTPHDYLQLVYRMRSLQRMVQRETWPALTAAEEAVDRATMVLSESQHLEGDMLKFKEIAKQIAACEGGKAEVNIAQISEVLRLALRLLAQAPASEVMQLIEKYKEGCK